VNSTKKVVLIDPPTPCNVNVPNDIPWGSEELEILQRCYSTTPKKELMKMLPIRTWSAIITKASYAGIKDFRRNHCPDPVGKLKISSVSFSEHIALVAAWVIACEGTISLRKNHNRSRRSYSYQPVISVSSTTRPLLDHFQELVKCGSINFDRLDKAGNPVYVWRLTSIRECLDFLEKIGAHLPIKKDQCRLLMKFCEIRDKCPGAPYLFGEEKIYAEIRRLNIRGKKQIENHLDRSPDAL